MGFKVAVNVQHVHAWGLSSGKGVMQRILWQSQRAGKHWQCTEILKCSGNVTDNLQNLKHTPLQVDCCM